MLPRPWTVLRLRDARRPEASVVVRASPDAVVADLLDALGAPEAARPLVDGRPVRREDALDEAGVCQGSDVRWLDPGPHTDSTSIRCDTPIRCGTPSVTLCDGLDAGRSFRLPAGDHLVGRSPTAAVRLDDPGVALLHGLLCVDAAGGAATLSEFGLDELPAGGGGDLGERPTPQPPSPASAPRVVRPGERVRCGAATMLLGVAGELAGAAATGGHTAHAGGTRQLDPRRDRTERATILFNRPPRSRAHAGAAPVAVPLPPPVPAVRSLALAAVVLPLVLAAALVAVTGSWLFALMTVLSPLLAMSAWLGSRRRARRDGRHHRQRYGAELAVFETALATLRATQDRERAERAVDLAEVAQRAFGPSPRLWERRPEDLDAWRVCVGHGPQRWQPSPPLTEDELDPAVQAVLRRVGAPADGPVEVDLGAHRVIGIVGDKMAARRVARSLVLQLAVHHGPADLAVELLVADDRREAWSWLGWLPHAPAAEARAPEQPSDAEAAGGPPGATARRSLLVVDDPRILGVDGANARARLRGERGPVVGIVLAPVADRLPASCRVVVAVDAVGTASLALLDGGEPVPALRAMGVAEDVAGDIAAALARFEDPDLARPGAGLPAVVRLDDVLAARCRWAAGRSGAPSGLRSLAVPIGLGGGGHDAAGRGPGPVVVDLVADGPHALVAGTTGAGKSELLRTWIAALAATYPPSDLHVVLVDFKGGSAFDACAALPHTVAVVTDLDEDLAARVLRSLHAELSHREQVLRGAGVADLADLADLADAVDVTGSPPLARLVVVIDEFATVKAELPDFLDALIGVAQRGRSLGVHLILATQRPSGVVSDQIRANTNIRIALRVQDPADSRDVVGVPDAASLDRRTPGRALVRLGRHDVGLVQTAYVGSPRSVPDDAGRRVERLVQDPTGHPGAGRSAGGSRGSAAGRSDLQDLVEEVAAEAGRLGLATPRVPWTPPLPARLPLAELLAALPPARRSGPFVPFVPFVLLDDPDHQRRLVGGWSPDEGNLLLYGAAGRGATEALVALLCSLVEREAPHRLHVYLVGEAPSLVALGGLPHVGTVVGRSDTERLSGLLGVLEAELAARRNRPADGASPPPTVVVAIDGLGSLLAVDGGAAAGDAAQRWARLIVEGPAQRLLTVATAEHAAAVRHSVAASVTQRLIFGLADPHDARQFGVAPVTGPPGRVRAVPGGLLGQAAAVDDVPAVIRAQTARYGEGAGERAGAGDDEGEGAGGRAVVVHRLPERIDRADLGEAKLDAAGATLRVPIGVAGPLLGRCTLALHRGEGVLVAGPSRSGRSNALGVIVAGLLAMPLPVAAGRVAVVVIAGRRSPLSSGGWGGPGAEPAPFEPERFEPADGEAWSRRLASGPPAGGWGVVVVDDAESVEDPSGALAAAFAAGWVVVAAGRNDALRSAYGHWSRAVRAARQGLLLRPEADLDGELLGVRLPRSTDAPLDRPGRGFLVRDGSLQVIQTALRSQSV